MTLCDALAVLVVRVMSAHDKGSHAEVEVKVKKILHQNPQMKMQRGSVTLYPESWTIQGCTCPILNPGELQPLSVGDFIAHCVGDYSKLDSFLIFFAAQGGFEWIPMSFKMSFYCLKIKAHLFYQTVSHLTLDNNHFLQHLSKPATAAPYLIMCTLFTKGDTSPVLCISMTLSVYARRSLLQDLNMWWLVMRTGRPAGWWWTPRAWLNRGSQAWDANSSTSSEKTVATGRHHCELQRDVEDGESSVTYGWVIGWLKERAKWTEGLFKLGILLGH